jgi:hypothetical protein
LGKGDPLRFIVHQASAKVPKYILVDQSYTRRGKRDQDDKYGDFFDRNFDDHDFDLPIGYRQKHDF